MAHNYPTPTARQLFRPPWAEFAILHLQLIAGSDRFANFVQWASVLGCLITASQITRVLGGSVRAQILSAVFVGTLPMGVLQASSTQNNYAVALWLSAFALAVVLIWNETGLPDWRHYLLGGAGVGLAMCTKGTSYFCAAPFVVLLVGVHVRRWRLTHLPVLFLAGFTALAITSANGVVDWPDRGGQVHADIADDVRNDAIPQQRRDLVPRATLLRGHQLLARKTRHLARRSGDELAGPGLRAIDRRVRPQPTVV